MRCKKCGKKLPDNQEYQFCNDKCDRTHRVGNVQNEHYAQHLNSSTHKNNKGNCIKYG